jgi:hypothetical protein
MAVDTLRQNDTFITELRHALREGEMGLSSVPALLKSILKEGRWREFRTKTGEPVHPKTFEEFVTTAPLEGLGATIDLLKRICKEDKEALDEIDKVIQREPFKHMDDVSNRNIIEPRPAGTTEQYSLRRLRKDRPDLHAKVLSRELSAHAAMIEAGFRKPAVTLPLDVEAASRTIVRHFQKDQLVALARELAKAAGYDLRPFPESAP